MAPDDKTKSEDFKHDPNVGKPLADLGIHAAGDPDSAEAPEAGDDSYRTAEPGKKVFKPGELNNAGEDKEYFHPKKDHHFDTPQDANNHALTPDVEVAPGNTVKTVTKD